MALVSRTVIGRGMARSASQIAISVVATLIATSIYSGMRREVGPAFTAEGPPVTAGGKYAARIAGAELPPLPEPAPPVLSIVNWAIAAPPAPRTVDDIAWSVAMAGVAGNARSDSAVVKAAKRAAKRPVIVVAAVPPSKPPLLVAPVSSLPIATTRPVEASVWQMATATAHSVVAFGGSAVALGTSTLARLIP